MYAGSRLSSRLPFRGNLLVVYALQHDSTLEKIFCQKSFSKSGMAIRNPKTKSENRTEKRELGKDRWCSQMGQVETVTVRGTCGTGTGEGGLHNGWDRMGLRQGFFRLGGTGWDWDRCVFRLGGT